MRSVFATSPLACLFAVLTVGIASTFSATIASGKEPQHSKFVPRPDFRPNAVGKELDGSIKRAVEGRRVLDILNQFETVFPGETASEKDDLYTLICGGDWFTMDDEDENGNKIEVLVCENEELISSLQLTTAAVPSAVVRAVHKKLGTLPPPRKPGVFTDSSPTSMYVPHWIELMCDDWLVMWTETASGGIVSGSIEIDCDGDPILLD